MARSLLSAAVAALLATTSVACVVTETDDNATSESALEASCVRARVDASDGLNVRKGPAREFERAGSLAHGTVVSLVERRDGWSRIEAPVEGWVSDAYLVCDAGSAPDAPVAPADSSCTEIASGITTCALRNELMWVDKERSTVRGVGSTSCNYQPDDLMGIDRVARPGAGVASIRRAVQPDLAALIAAARNGTGEIVSIRSAYRGFDDQVKAYNRWKNECESAYPGHSEHQLGTTVDLQVEGKDPFVCNTGFEATRAYRWLLEHAHEHGFTLSYPHCNGANYREETWHIRWVGRALAKVVHDAQVAARGTMSDVVADSISFHDWLRCKEGDLPFVFGREVDEATGRTEVLPSGQFASMCTAAGGTRYGTANQRCDGYCEGKPACEPRDMGAICALFPDVGRVE